jgi:hypothetical protein
VFEDERGRVNLSARLLGVFLGVLGGEKGIDCGLAALRLSLAGRDRRRWLGCFRVFSREWDSTANGS